MYYNLAHLMKTRRFLPLFLTQFLGAFNDNLYRTSLVTYVTFQATGFSESTKSLLVSLAVGLFMLPYFLFSATAGQLADKYNKAQLIRWVKLAELIIMLCGAAAFLVGNVWLLIAVLFFMGAHSAIFGPAKYSILPDHLKESELLGGNGLVEAGTFAAILLGTFFGGILMGHNEYGPHVVSGFMMFVAVFGYLACRFIPDTKRAAPNTKISLNFLTATYKLVQESRKEKLFGIILLISWFWLIGAGFLSQIPNLAHNQFMLTETGLTLLMVTFSFGVGLGSLLCNVLLKNHISAKLVPGAALLITLFVYDFSHVDLTRFATGGPYGAWAFLSTMEGLRTIIDLFIIAVAGGVYIVPLYALLQSDSDDNKRSQIIAANNVMNALFMVIASILAAILLGAGLSVMHFFTLLAVLNGLITLYLIRRIPDTVLRAIFHFILRVCYRVEVKGLQHYKAAGKRVVIISNHTSFLDAAIIATFLPDKITFAINTHIAQRWWVKPFLSVVKAIPVDPTHAMSTRLLIQHVRKNERLAIFPEGRITTTGSLMKVYEGPGMIADKADAMLLPIRISGAEYTPFSRLKGKVRIRWFRPVTITILPPRQFKVKTELQGRKRRLFVSSQLYDVMSQALFESSNSKVNLFQSFVEAMDTHGHKTVIAEDIQRTPLSYRQLLLRSLVLGRYIAKQTTRGEFVGLLLPNAIATVAAFLGILAYARVPVMLNFSTGNRNVGLAVRTAGLKKVYTSQKFIETARMHTMIQSVEDNGAKVFYLEDARKNIGVYEKASAWLRATFGLSWLLARLAPATDTATMLFTSGSEGAPKGVALSHVNLQSNRYQIAARIDFGPRDIVFSALPMFHSFGLGVGLLLPLMSGIRVFLYPSPLHYRIVPEMVYDTNATMLFGTDTFLTGYAKFAHPYDFYSVRYVVAGAERLKPETRKTWVNRFGIRILEGYGVTETSPVVALNTPMHSKAGSVGRMVPGMGYRLEHVPGIEEGGRLFLKGPNVMQGYMFNDNPGVIMPPAGGWHDTGDIVSIDTEGYIKILGRAKRFAKIGGEMVSLAAVEEIAGQLWPNHQHAVVSLPDPKKGEQLVLVTDNPQATRAEFSALAKELGHSELFVPKRLEIVSALPVLGTGKIDYVTIQAQINETKDA